TLGSPSHVDQFVELGLNTVQIPVGTTFFDIRFRRNSHNTQLGYWIVEDLVDRSKVDHRALVWTAVMTTVSHINPAFSNVVAIEAVNKSIMDANQTPGYGTFQKEFVLVVHAVELLGIPPKTGTKDLGTNFISSPLLPTHKEPFVLDPDPGSDQNFCPLDTCINQAVDVRSQVRLPQVQDTPQAFDPQVYFKTLKHNVEEVPDTGGHGKDDVLLIDPPVPASTSHNSRTLFHVAYLPLPAQDKPLNPRLDFDFDPDPGSIQNFCPIGAGAAAFSPLCVEDPPYQDYKPLDFVQDPSTPRSVVLNINSIHDPGPHMDMTLTLSFLSLNLRNNDAFCLSDSPVLDYGFQPLSRSQH
ncbi:hypothetical protein DXG01_007269, partial [Tephrocybe rancida]